MEKSGQTVMPYRNDLFKTWGVNRISQDLRGDWKVVFKYYSDPKWFYMGVSFIPIGNASKKAYL